MVTVTVMLCNLTRGSQTIWVGGSTVLLDGLLRTLLRRTQPHPTPPHAHFLESQSHCGVKGQTYTQSALQSFLGEELLVSQE